MADQYIGQPKVTYGDHGDDPDYSPEIFVGRLLCSSAADIATWTEKVILYEQNPGRGDFSYLTESFMVSADQMRNQPDSVSPHLPATFNHLFFKEQPSGSSLDPTAYNGASVISEMNNIYGLFSFFGHGSPISIATMSKGYNDYPSQRWCINTVDNIEYHQHTESGNSFENLTNVNYPAIAYSIGCDNNPFDDYEISTNPGRNLGEGFTVMSDAGGSAFLGNSRIGWAWSSHRLYIEFADLLDTGGSNLHLGIAELISKDNNTSSKHSLSYSHNLIGCPETQMWVQTPTLFSNVTVTDNGSSITVDGKVSGSTISICSDDDGSTYHLVADNVSNYTFTTSHRPCFITVTNENYIPYYAITGGSISQDQEWFGNMHVLDNVTIPTGKTLAISEGSTLLFKAGKIMNVNGILNAQGTSSNPVTFTRSGTSGTWAGIKVYGNATINNATIEYAGQGVSFLNPSTGSILNSELHDNNYGIYVNGSLPTIQTCNIHDNNGWGIYIYNTNNIGTAGAKTQVLNNLISGNGSYGIDLYNASPSIQNNEIYNQTYGIYGYSNCSPYLGQYEEYGNNNIHDNTYGIGVMNNSNPFLGEENCVVHGGHNQFTANTNYIAASYNCYIQAEQNWWGSNPPQSSKFYITNGSTIDYTPWLVSPPSTANMVVGPNEEKQFDAAFGIANDSNAPVVDYMNYYSPDWPMEHKLLFARNIYLLGDIKDSQDICKDVIENYPDSSLSFFALDLLWQSSRDAEPNSELGLGSFNSYIKNIASNNKKKILYGYCTLVQSGFEQDKSKLLVSADKIYDGYQGTFLAEVALFQKFSYYFHEEKNLEMARVIAGQIKDEFPNSVSAIKTDEFLKYSTDSQNKIAKSNTVNENSPIVPVKFNVTFNYPNPFNPSTRIEYALPEISNIEIAIFNTLGQQLKLVRKFQQPKGRYTFTWDGKDNTGLQSPTGLYVLRFIAETAGPKKVRFIKSIKMLLIR